MTRAIDRSVQAGTGVLVGGPAHGGSRPPQAHDRIPRVAVRQRLLFQRALLRLVDRRSLVIDAIQRHDASYAAAAAAPARRLNGPATPTLA